ncbi:MAG: nucleotidyltransferase domain-containing protein [Actinomycetota bacterium]|jgi:predicted nucleotidyltransferase|nr:nucleotidyltransferase domain-containing protein [Actinomycetota bacterium]
MPALADARLSAAERRMLDRFVLAMREHLGDDLLSVWLFGSRARGEDTGPLSDVDVLLVTRSGREDEAAAWRYLADLAEEEGLSPVLLSLVVWDPEWLAHRREIRSFFIQEVDRDKIVLHGSP